MGHGVYLITSKGTSHEWGWTTYDDYGRMAPYIFDFYRVSGDLLLRDKAIQMERAHHVNMLYALVDRGGYRAMLNEGAIVCRNVFLPGKTSYADPAIAATLLDPVILGTAKQMIAEGHFWDVWRQPESQLYLPDNYAIIKAAPDPGSRPPQLPGQPNWAWADEQNGLVSIHYHNDQHFLSFYRKPTGMNHLADAHSITAQYQRVAEFWMDDVRYVDSGQAMTIESRVENEGDGVPPDKPVNAWAGQVAPYARDEQGKANAATIADFYGVRYGDFVIGMNCTFHKTFPFAPQNFTAGVDLISGQQRTAPVAVPPQTTVVFHMPVKVPAVAPPPRPGG